MAYNIGTIEGLLVLRDRFSSELNRAASQLEDTATRMNKVGRQMSDVGSRLTQTLSLPLIALGGFAVKSASDFESSFAGVRKTVDATEKELQGLAQGFRDLAKTIPINVNELNKVGEAAGQLGIHKDDILEFSRVMADLGNTTNLTADEAATAVAQFQNIFGAAGKEVDRFGSTLVALGNAGASTEKDILSMGVRIAGAGNQIGLSQGQVLAYASALSSLGIEAEAGGSAISRVMVNIALAVSRGGTELTNFAAVAGQTSAQFKQQFQTDAAGAVNAFIAGLGRMKSSGQDVLGTLDQMGISEIRMRDALLRLAGSGDLLTKSLALQAKAWKDNSALTEEAKKRYETFESQLKLTWGRIRDVGITIGTSLMPVLRDLVSILEPLINKLAKLAEWFATLPKGVRATILVMAGLAATIGPVLLVTGQLLQSWAALVVAAPRLAAAVHLAAGPWGAFTLAVTAATLAITTWLDRWKTAMDEATALSVKLGNLEGAAHRFNQVIKESGGRVTKSIVVQAREDAQQLADQLNKATARVDELKKKLAAPGVGGGPGISGDQAFIVQGQLRAAEEEVAKITSAYERQKAALRGITTVYEDITTEAGTLTQQNAGLVQITAELSKHEKELGDDLAAVREELVGSIAQNNKIIAALGRMGRAEQTEVEKRLDGIRRSHELHVAYLQDVDRFGKAAADALKPLREADYDAAQAADRAEQAFTSLVEVVKETGKLAAKGFSDFLQKGVQAGIEKMEEDARKTLRRMDILRDLEEEAEFEIRVSAVDAATPRLREIEEQYLALVRSIGEGSVAAGEAVLGNLQSVIDEVKARLGSISDSRALTQIRGAGKSSLTVFREEQAELERLRSVARARNLDMEEDFHAAIQSNTREFWGEQLGAWQSALGFLADRFGGFFGQLADLAAGLQQARQFGQSVQSAASGLGSSASFAASLGGIATVVAIFAVVYDFVDKMIKKAKSVQYSNSTEFNLVGGEIGVTALERNSYELIHAIEDVVREFGAALGGTITDLDKIGIAIRNDGKYVAAFVNEVMIGHFDDVDSAIRAAVLSAFRDGGQIKGISDLVRQALEEDSYSLVDVESSFKFFDQLRQISDLAKSQGQLSLESVLRGLEELWHTLTKMGQATPAVVAGFNDLTEEIVLAWQNWQDSITGRERTPAELLFDKQREGQLFNARLQLYKAELAMKAADIKAQLELLKARGRLLAGGGHGQGTSGGAGGGLLNVYANEVAGQTAYVSDKAKLARAEMEIQAAQLGVQEEIVDAQADLFNQTIANLELQLKAIDGIINALPDLIDIGSIRLPRGGGRGGGAGGGRDQVRDFIRDRSLELELSALGEYARRLREIGIQYEEQLKQAGRDVALRAKLLALKEEELALLAKEQRQSTVARFREFLGLVTPFESVRQTAEDLIKQIKDSPFGDERKARMIGRVLAKLELQLDRLAQEMALGLLGELSADLEKFGADEKLLLQVRQQMAVIEHTLKMAHYKAEIAILRAEGRLSAEVLATLDAAFKFLEGIDPRRFLDPAGGGVTPAPPRPGQTAQDLYRQRLEEERRAAEDRRRQAVDLLKRYRDQAIDPFHRALRDLNEDFRLIRLQLGDTAEVMKLYADALKRLEDQYLDGLRELYEELRGGGPASGATVQQQYDTQYARWLELAAAVRGGDLSQAEAYRESAQRLIELLGQMYGTSTGGFAEIRDQILRDLEEILGIGRRVQGAGGGAGAGGGIVQLPSSPLQLPMPISPISAAASSTALANPLRSVASAIYDGSDATVEATEDVGNRIGYHGVRQEKLLGKVGDALERLIKIVKTDNRSAVDRLGYGPSRQPQRAGRGAFNGERDE